jgi:hypothetical protein
VGYGNNVELYSPSGKCNHKLEAFPSSCQNPVLVNVDKKIIACSGSQSCWEYNVKEDNWTVIATAPFSHNYQPGVVYKEKVYVMDESSPKVFIPSSKTWSSWPPPPKKSGTAPGMVGWKDCIILFGGSSNLRGIQIFNISEQSWTVKDSNNVPMDFRWSSSLSQSNGNILVVGSEERNYSHSAAIYNPTDNTWRMLEKTATSHFGSRLVQLGSRIFATDGYQTGLVEEFILETYTWKPVDVKLQVRRNGYHSLLALPAHLFSHLQGGCQGVEE